MAARKVTRQIGDTQIPVGATLQRANGTVVNLTGLTVKFAMYTTGGAVKLAATASNVTIDDDPTTGKVEYDFQAADVATAGTFYAYFITFDGSDEKDTFPVIPGDLSIIVQSTVATDVVIGASYSNLVERVGHQLFGIRVGHVPDQLKDIEECIKDGLHDVYNSHKWSFFRPIEPITTTAPFTEGTVVIVDGVVTLTGDDDWPSWAAVGVLKVDSGYYDVATLTDADNLILEDTTVDVDALTTFSLCQLEYDLPSNFEAIEGDLTYEPGQNCYYPAVKQKHDGEIRRQLQYNPYINRPLFYGIRTVEFDPTVGSRRRLTLYPLPDAVYVLKARMKLRATMIDETNQYPVGGEMLSAVILEACLAVAERTFDEQEGLHTKRFQELLPLAIASDLEATSPTQLGKDDPRDERRRLNPVRIGDISFNGVIQ